MKIIGVLLVIDIRVVVNGLVVVIIIGNVVVRYMVILNGIVF